MRPVVALATCATLPELFADEHLLMAALDRRGVEARPLVWSTDPGPTGETGGARRGEPWFDACILRNTWDYYLHLEAFLAWAEGVSDRVPLWNPLPLVRWNAHKGYLLDLSERGIPIVPTVLLPRGTAFDLAGTLAARGWSDVVLKPAVSAGAHRTRRHREGRLDVAQAHLEDLLQGPDPQDALLQPYLAAVDGYGERSFLVIDGELTHAVKRTAALTEGVGLERTMDRVEPTEAEAALAHRTLAALPFAPLYARVDLVPDGEGNPQVMEVEVIEPRLFLQEAPHAAERFAAAILRRLEGA